MRFNFSPETGYFTIYASPDEFQLAVGTTDEEHREYRVIQKEIKNKDGSVDTDALTLLLYEYGDFMGKILESLDSGEKIKDVLVISTKSRTGFRWKSLYDLDKTGKSNNFFETMFNYALQCVRDSNLSKNNEGKSLSELFSERDFAKLTLAQVLLSSISHPVLWRMRGKSSNEVAEIVTRTKTLKTRLDKFETKYGFASDEMQKYYSDDKFPEKDMEEWLSTYQQFKVLIMTSEKFAQVERMVDDWCASFGNVSL